MIPIVITAGPFTAANATNIRTASAAPIGALTLNGSLVSGGVATLDTTRRILLTFAGDGTDKNYTVVGTNGAGDTITEVIAGVNTTTVSSVLDYETIISVTASASLASNLSIGTTTVGGSRWARLDNEWALPNLSVQAIVSGTINYTVLMSYDDPNSPTNPVAAADMTWSTLVAAAAATAITQFAYAPTWVRVQVNSFTAGAGDVTTTLAQTGVVPQ